MKKKPSRAFPLQRTQARVVSTMKTLAISAALSLAFAPASVYAQQAAQHIDIQSQPLSEALIQLGTQTSLQIFYAQNVVAGLTAPRISGNLAPEQALKQLLQGTAITFTREGNNVTLTRANTASSDATLNTVVVTASGFEQDIKDAPATISVITQEELKNKSYRDVNDALSDVPGVIITGGNRPDISIRGMGSKYTLVLVDGKRQNSRDTRPNSDGAGVEGGWTPPISAIERIEVVRGPMSSLYGSDAMGGVVNIITRKVPQQWHGEVRTEAILQEHDRSGNNYQGNFYLSGPIKSDLLGLQVYGQQSRRIEDEFSGGIRGSNAKNITAKLALTPNKNHDITLEATEESQKGDQNIGRTLAPTATANTPFDYTGSKWSLAHTGRWGFGVSDTYIHQEEYDNPTRQMKIKNTNIQSSLTASPVDTHMLTMGLSYMKQDLIDLENKNISQIDRYQWAVFLEDEWRITNAFALTAGIRLDDDQNFGSHASPRLYGVWHANDNWTVKGGVSSGFRAPDLRQTVIGLSQVSRGGNIYGNPNLKPETSISQELGLLYDNQQGFNAGVTIFNNDFKDKITRITCLPGTPCDALPKYTSGGVVKANTSTENVDEAITRGIETNMAWAFAQTWSMAANYTYTKSEQKSGEFKGKPLNKLPMHMMNVSLKWQPTDAMEGWVRANYRGKESEPTSGASASSIMAPSSTLLDLGGSYAINKMLTLYAGVYNLFDKEIMNENYDYVQDGRRYWLGLSAKF